MIIMSEKIEYKGTLKETIIYNKILSEETTEKLLSHCTQNIIKFSRAGFPSQIGLLISFKLALFDMIYDNEIPNTLMVILMEIYKHII